MAHIVRPLVNQNVDACGIVFMPAGDQRILIMQIEAVIFKIEHSRHTTLGKRAVGKCIFPLGEHQNLCVVIKLQRGI